MFSGGLTGLWSWLENTPFAMHVGESWWFPFLESMHVLSATLVLGSLLMLDLRLIGVAARGYTVSSLSRELMPWTWGAFMISLLSGVSIFSVRASSYVVNPAMQIKFVFLILAGINMLLFHFGVFRDVARWDITSTPNSAKAAGLLSLLLWAGVMLTGRWVGHLT